MQYNDDIQATLLAIQQLFKDAEAQAKTAELEYGQGPIIPAINELRYAGSHIISFLCATSLEDQKQELDKAARHCKRSIYDAVEARLMVSFERYRTFRDKYQNLNLLSKVPNILEMTQIAQEIERMISTRQPDETKDAHYENLRTLHDNFKPHINAIDVADIELQKDLNNYDRTIDSMEQQMAAQQTAAQQQLQAANDQLTTARRGNKLMLATLVLTAVGIWITYSLAQSSSSHTQQSTGLTESRSGSTSVEAEMSKNPVLTRH